MCLFPQEGPLSKRARLVSPICGQMCDIFICHRGPEAKGNIVGHIKERLQRANLIVFVDYEMRKAVDSWQHVLATLRGARRVLMLLTPSYEESPWCLEEARAAAARLDAVLPVFVDRKPSWDEGKLRAASSEFSADRDFDQIRAGEPGLAANIVDIWCKALDSVARVSYMMHSSRCKPHSLSTSFLSYSWWRTEPGP